MPMSATALAHKESLADLLLQEGKINEDQYRKALSEYDRSKRSLVRIFTDMGILNDFTRMKLFRDTLNVKMVDLKDVVPRTEVAGFIGRDACRKRMAVPLLIEDGVVVVAMEDPTDMRTLSDMEKVFSMPVKPVLAKDEEILECIVKLPDEGASSISGIYPRIDDKPGINHVATLSLMMMVFIPILLFYYFVAATEVGREVYGALNLTAFENILVFVIVWGSWASIAYFFNDLIFGKSDQ